MTAHTKHCDCDACCMAQVKPIGRPMIRGQAPLDSKHRRHYGALTDVDGIDGPADRAWARAKKEDAS